MIKRSIIIIAGIIAIMFLLEGRNDYAPNYTKLSSYKTLFEDDMAVSATNGSEYSNESFKDKYTFVFFGYTNCPDFCPDTLVKLKQLLNYINKEDLNKSVNIVFINVDTNDSLDKIKKYVEYFDPSFVGIKLDDGDLEKITKRVGVYYKKISTQDGVNFFDHTGAIFVINKSSKIIGLYTPPITIDLMKEDILYGLR